MLVKLFQIGLRLHHQSLLSDISERLRDNLIESSGLLYKLFLHREQIPIFADRLEQIVEKFVKLLAQVVPDEEDVIPEVDLVLAQRRAN